MRFLAKAVVPSFAVALLLAACGSSSSTTTSTAPSSGKPVAQTSASPATVKTATSSQGTILVNSSGMTLYALSAEKNGKFICTQSACTAVWHPLTVSAGVTPAGVSSLTTVKRPDGTTQVAYKGAPLYTFASDQAPGETKGQGIKDVGTWSVVTVGAAPAAAPATTSTQSESSSSSEGSGSKYGY